MIPGGGAKVSKIGLFLAGISGRDGIVWMRTMRRKTIATGLTARGTHPMATPGSMTRWADDLRSPDQQVRDRAAYQIWERYSTRLLALVRRNLNERIGRREDPDDILQNMYKSFCANRERASDPLRSRDELWKLLVHIAMCKIANAAHHHQAACRDVRREVAGQGDPGDDATFPRWILERMDREEPTPDEALILEEELQRWLEPLPPDLRQVALWKME